MEYKQPFDHNYFIGYVSQVLPDSIRVHFPSSVLLNKFIFSGEEFNAGLVGNYVTIEGESFGFIGKIIELSLPEKERLVLNEKDFQSKEFHPAGKIEILLSFDYFNPDQVLKGLSSYPNIGAKVFICPSGFIQQYFRSFGVKPIENFTPPIFDFGVLLSDGKTTVEVAQQALFGRHCAIVGTTGGGKSYTVSKCIEEILKNGGKTLLIDATGEYSSFDSLPKVASPAILIDDTFFHYTNLTVEDIFALLRPSGQVQAPKLLEAIKSLKILRVLENNEGGNLPFDSATNSFSIYDQDKLVGSVRKTGDNLKKFGELHKPFNVVYFRHIEEIDGSGANFDIRHLPRQIMHECVYDIDFNDHEKWGGFSDNHRTNCMSLILRTQSLINHKEFANVFGIQKEKSDLGELSRKIEQFINGPDNLLRIGFEKVGYEFQAREILANAIGKYLLQKARSGAFKENPLVLFIDEAHQYLNKNVKDEYFDVMSLNSYDQIAKECRKHGLFLCLATQMPRDIPIGTLSQMGTFIVHRLINPYDKEAVANACSVANRNTLSFLPILGEGEAILMGVDFPMPVLLKVNKPTTEPFSKTPLFRVNINDSMLKAAEGVQEVVEDSVFTSDIGFSHEDSNNVEEPSPIQ